MMEGQNLGGEGQSVDKSQPIGDDSKLVRGAMDVVQAVADGGGKVELGSGGGGGGGGGEVVKKKRGRPPKAQAKHPPAKKNKEEEEEEDVCFICFDGGSLVLCDRRGCPKAYHPTCIKRDEAFFQSAARWNCGWHICSLCQKAAHHMCYTCTFSLCKACIKKSDYVGVRNDKGFCTICMKTIMLIENNGQGEDGKVEADFDDKLSWEYLFKVYWVFLKGNLSLTVDELIASKKRSNGASTVSSALPSTGVHNRANDLRSITSAASFGNAEANESKRRKIDEQVNILPKETVNTEKVGNDDSLTMVECKEWATKELLDFIAHMKNGDTSVVSQLDVQALMIEYIKINNLHDPRKKNQIICDVRLKNIFGKPRVGHNQMRKLLERHFLIKEDSQKSTVNSNAVQDDANWNHANMLMVSKDRKPRNRSKGEGRVVQNRLDDFAAVDVHNMNLLYLRRDLMEKLLEDTENFHDKVVGSLVRIRISGSDLKHDMYRLVQVVGTSKVDVPYKVDSKLADIMLEVLNLDKKETISIDTVSDQEFTEEECRRLQQSIQCGLVKHFIVGEIQEKAVALQPVKLNDWTEKEILRLNHARDAASEKGHKKSYRECVEKLQLLNSPDERERRLKEIPVIRSDPKMNPHYESDDTEEYFNKEHGDHMESKYSRVSSKNSRSPKKRAARSNATNNKSRKNERSKSKNVEDGSTKDLVPSTLAKSQNEPDCNGSTITKSDHQATFSSTVSNSAPETIASSHSTEKTSSPNDLLWHYLDPYGKVQGPFSILQLQRWSTTGYFPTDMMVWASHEDKSLLLTDVLKEQLHNHDAHQSENIITSNKTGNQTEGLNVCSAIPSAAVAVTPYAPDPVNHEKLSDSHGSSGQSFGQNWSANNNLNGNPTSVASLTLSNESTGQLNDANMPMGTVRNEADIKHVSTVCKDADAALFDLPGPTPKKAIVEDEKMQSLPDSKLLIQDSGNPPSWSSASSLVVGGAKLPVSADGWGGCSSTPVKREEWDSGLVSVSSFKPLEVAGDHVATPTSNIDQNIQSSQPCNDLPTWHGMGEMIEFSTLAEESVSDLLAEVDAMESQYGLPSPTSRRNSFVDDLFNGSFDEFSPTPDQGTRSDGFSSSGDIQLPCQSTTTTTTDEHLVGGSSRGNNINAFDLMKTSNGLQLHSFISHEIDGQASIGIPQRTNSENMVFEWPEMERDPQNMIDINRSAKAEGEEGEMETKTSDVVKVKVENGNYIQPVAPLDTFQNRGGSSHAGADGGGIILQAESTGDLKSTAEPMRAPKTAGASNHMRVGNILDKEEDDRFFQPPPPPPAPPLTLGLDPFDLRGWGSEGKANDSGRSGNIGWEANENQNHRRYGSGERYNSSNSQQHPVEEGGCSRSSRSGWNKQPSFGSGNGGGAGGYSRQSPPAKGQQQQQRVCKFYESGRCKKGASCKYLHP
ncbi:zinc finger CCCH domain-containing protein 44-like [Cynara cardunculus var. scolymus]|uniref:zinc finger CCCH domain-containing protein 44-like n=1 Tax=Cynara cardunculus var. scolymus TaxID=59895 RepID=UPI000D6246C4|nr:zinc finger CCCH domain-containing protein 44-like [Cynara cardunculus var. scolymus]